MTEDNSKKKLLLHVCCAPCVVYVFEVLEPEYEVTGYFYNPNIQPEGEFVFRREELKKVAALKNWRMIYPDYVTNPWDEAVKGLEDEPERGRRCTVCFYQRLRKTFEYAAANRYDLVASTLSISPYKNTGQINREGDKLAGGFGVGFLGENFKKQDGYNKARKRAHDLDIKHQNYCGCLFSKNERERKTSDKGE